MHYCWLVGQFSGDLEHTFLVFGGGATELTVTSIALEKSSWMTVLSMYCTVVPLALPLTTDTPVSAEARAVPTVGSRYASNAKAAMQVAVLRYSVSSGAPLALLLHRGMLLRTRGLHVQVQAGEFTGCNE